MTTDYIQDMRCTSDGVWHQYDFILNGRYGWQYMLESAEYVLQNDFIPLASVTRAEHPGGTEAEILPDIKKSDNSIINCPAATVEGSMLAVAGFSMKLKCMVKTVWLNQTNRLRIFTSENKTDDIKSYVTKLMERDFITDKKEQKVHRIKLQKEKYKSTPGERRAGAIVIIALGTIWTLGGLSMVAVLEDFLPYGFAWFIISFGFIAGGIAIYRKSKEEQNSQIKTTLPVAFQQKDANIAQTNEKLWIIVNTFNPAIPFIEGDNSISLFADNKKTMEYIHHNQGYSLQALSLERSMLENMKDLWQRYGIHTVKINEKDNSSTIIQCCEKRYIGSETENTVIKLMQNSPAVTEEKKALYSIEADSLRRILAQTPLLVPFRYDDDDIRQAKEDRQIHMTEKACTQLSALLKNEAGQPKQDIPVYYGMEKLRGEHTVTMWHSGKVIYYGGAAVLRETANDEKSGMNTRIKIMHPMFADNPKENLHMVAVFTNIADLKELYKQHRVALFSFSELATLAKEGDGIIINPGAKGICAQLNHSLINELYI